MLRRALALAMPARSALARRLLLTAAGVVGALATGCDGRPPPPSPGVQWVDGLTDGLAAAAAKDTPALVYVRQLDPPSSTDATLARDIFDRAESRVLSDRYVAIRVTMGDADTPPLAELGPRLAIREFPALAIVNGRGHVIATAAEPALTGELSPTGKPTLDDLLETLEWATANEAAVAALAASEQPADRLRLARELLRRRAGAEALAVLRDLVAAEPSSVHLEALADAHAATGDVAGERRTLERLVAGHPDADAAMSWRVRLATVDLQTPAQSRDEWHARLETAIAALRALRDEVCTSTAAAAAAEVRTELGRRLSQAGDHAAAVTELDWVLEHAADAPAAPRALLEKGNVRFREADYAAAKACFERLLERYPASPEAERAPEGIRNCDSRLGL